MISNHNPNLFEIKEEYLGIFLTSRTPSLDMARFRQKDPLGVSFLFEIVFVNSLQKSGSDRFSSARILS